MSSYFSFLILNWGSHSTVILPLCFTSSIFGDMRKEPLSKRCLETSGKKNLCDIIRRKLMHIDTISGKMNFNFKVSVCSPPVLVKYISI